jgi:hypothetical protein
VADNTQSQVAAERNEETSLLHFVGGADLTLGELLDSKIDNNLLNVFFDMILEYGFF